VGCEVSLLDRLCPVCRGDYARAPREWSPLAAQQGAEGECVTSVALAAVPSQLGLVELAITFPRLERLSIVIPRQESRSRGGSNSSSSADAPGAGNIAAASEGNEDVEEEEEEEAEDPNGSGTSSNDEAENSAAFNAGQPLDFASEGVIFPRLLSLELDGLPRLQRLVFTLANTPRLVSLVVRRCGGRCAPLVLNLPRLAELELADLRARQPSSWDATTAGVLLGHALSGCPRLASCTLTRVSGLGGENFVGLPRLVTFVATQCVGLEQLDLVDCPRLETVAMQGCKHLKRLRIHDVGVRTARFPPFSFDHATAAGPTLMMGPLSRSLGRAAAGADTDSGAAEEAVAGSGGDGSSIGINSGGSDGRVAVLWNVEDSIGFGVEDAGALAVALDEVRASVEACVGDEQALWARGARGDAEAQALGWLDLFEGGRYEPLKCARFLEDHLADLFDNAYHHARKHVVRDLPTRATTLHHRTYIL
jgi:hypothetical protein